MLNVYSIFWMSGYSWFPESALTLLLRWPAISVLIVASVWWMSPGTILTSFTLFQLCTRGGANSHRDGFNTAEWGNILPIKILRVASTKTCLEQCNVINQYHWEEWIWMMVLILARGKRVEKMQTLECVLFSYFRSVEGCYQRGSGAWETCVISRAGTS